MFPVEHADVSQNINKNFMSFNSGLQQAITKLCNTYKVGRIRACSTLTLKIHKCITPFILVASVANLAVN